MYDDFHDIEYSEDKVRELLKLYLKWCEQNNQTPEVNAINDVNENNIGHVAYHAKLVNREKI